MYEKVHNFYNKSYNRFRKVCQDLIIAQEPATARLSLFYKIISRSRRHMSRYIHINNAGDTHCHLF